MLRRGCFVTGTDTGVGKTAVALGLIHALRGHGLRVAAMKPVAAGARQTADGLRNEDAELLAAASGTEIPYERVNPVVYEPAVAPHLAAERAGRPIEFEPLLRVASKLRLESDALVVEGAGGWLVPLDARRTMADLAAGIGLPVVLVVGVRLGCLNHALLSALAIERSRVPLAGWFAVRIDPACELAAENVADLRARLAAPLLGDIPYLDDPYDAALVAGSLSLPELHT